MQKDPIRFGGGDENLYRYVGNDVVNSVDPSGESVFIIIIGGTTLAYSGGYAAGTFINSFFIDKKSFKNSIKDSIRSVNIFKKYFYSVTKKSFGPILGPATPLVLDPRKGKTIIEILRKKRENEMKRYLDGIDSNCK
jgi:hypothetical protein